MPTFPASTTDAAPTPLGYLFDLDGVLWRGDQLIPGVRETLAELRRRGKRVLFISNTSSRSRQQCLEQFREMGLEVASEELFIASEATARYIAARRPGATVYVIGGKQLLEEMCKAGLTALPAETRLPEPADYVVVGKDSHLNYTKLTCALRALRAGAQLVAVNMDMTVPASDGLEPGAGAIVTAIAAMVGRQPDVMIGKPSPFLLQQALDAFGLQPSECVMVGDTPEADVAAGKLLGVRTALVLTGNTARSDLENGEALPPAHMPDMVLDSLTDLLRYEREGFPV